MVLQHDMAQAIVEAEPVITCRHYWIIDTAQGPVSKGVCQYCHEVREFQNSITEVDRDY